MSFRLIVIEGYVIELLVKCTSPLTVTSDLTRKRHKSVIPPFILWVVSKRHAIGWPQCCGGGGMSQFEAITDHRCVHVNEFLMSEFA